MGELSVLKALLEWFLRSSAWSLSIFKTETRLEFGWRSNCTRGRDRTKYFYGIAVGVPHT